MGYYTGSKEHIADIRREKNDARARARYAKEARDLARDQGQLDLAGRWHGRMSDFVRHAASYTVSLVEVVRIGEQERELSSD